MQTHARNRKATTPARLEAGRQDVGEKKRQATGHRSTLMVRAGLILAAFSLGMLGGEYVWPSPEDELEPIATAQVQKIKVAGGVAGLALGAEDQVATQVPRVASVARQASRAGSLRREASTSNENVGISKANADEGGASAAASAKAELLALMERRNAAKATAKAAATAAATAPPAAARAPTIPSAAAAQAAHSGVPTAAAHAPIPTAAAHASVAITMGKVRDVNALPLPTKISGKLEAVFQASTIVPTIAEWNGHSSAYSLTLDDGSDGMITFAPMTMNEFGIKGTYFITPQFVDAPQDSPKPAQLPNKWPHVVRLAAAGHEVGAHTTSHRNFGMESNREFTQEDFTTVIKRLEKEVPSWAGADFTMAYPFGGRNQMSTDIASKLYIGARTTTCKSMRSTEFTSETAFANIFGCEYGKGANPGTVNKIFDRASDDHAWVVSLAHGLGCELSLLLFFGGGGR